jgi:DNA-directed RNA polymerase beta' subunit
MESMPVSKIIGVQFGTMSPDEIIRSSVCKVVSKDTYIGNKPIVGGLFDPYMGVIEPDLICVSDGLDYFENPGYHGHIELSRPVFYIQYLSTVQKLLTCVCINCGKLLISKLKNIDISNKSAEQRWKFVITASAKIAKCGDDTNEGCTRTKPGIKKEGLATLFAVWKNGNKILITPEIALSIFRKISDEDLYFMGFNPECSRPESFICQVLLVPPPQTRPSVKHDAMQRSEDDLTYILTQIIKSNKSLSDKIKEDAQVQTINTWTYILQYFVAAFINNKNPGVPPVNQRSGRPLKSIIDRLNGKNGRIRGNLMAKRVDYSARSVITADPAISITELGVPLKIAMNITKPVVVNSRNIEFLTQLIRNGPDVYIGAKSIDRKNSIEVIPLRYADRHSIVLEYGDVVHRHMMDGDVVLFNRQPTLHRMSMMGHIVKVLMVGDTFRMNVADTKCYNADFDGDEMNMHMPQSIEAETELKYIASIPNQIISPGNNKSIIGVFQDGMIGAYRFTRKGVKLSPKEAMVICANISRLIPEFLADAVKNDTLVSSFDIMSQTLPPISLKYKTKLFNQNEDENTSNNIIEIVNGTYIRGQIEKPTFDSHNKGLIQHITNSYNNERAVNFIDDIQNIFTEYLKTSAFSVGISDLMIDDLTKNKIGEVINLRTSEVNNLIKDVQLGKFINETNKTNAELFEEEANNKCNKILAEAGKIALQNINSDNRLAMMVKAGSKGSEINITQTTSCLGQQSVDGKRIPNGFENRTLPHFTKWNDGVAAKGCVLSSFIDGLNPQEFMFHSMGGRVGLIDTAVKSVTWETPIVIIENGQSKYTEIGRWIDSHLDNNTEKVKHYTERQMELLDIDNVYIPTTDYDGNVTWGEITALTRHDPGDELFEIKTSGGRSVIVTESKSLLVWNDETKQFIEKYTPDINIGDYVPVTAELCSPMIINDDCVYNASVKKTIELLKIYEPKLFNDILVIIVDDDMTKFSISMLLSRLGIYSTFNNTSVIISNENIKIYYDIVHNYTYNYSTESKEIRKNNVVLDEIIEINKVDVSKHPKVYDLTIPSTLNFGLANGLQVRDTASTGYIQRRLIKGLEDACVGYDMTVRMSNNKIIQFKYGGDAIDPTKIENQHLGLVEMSYEAICKHFYDDHNNRAIECAEWMIKMKHLIIKNVFKNKNDSTIHCPVAFSNIIQNVEGRFTKGKSSIEDAWIAIDRVWMELSKTNYTTPNDLFKVMYYFSLSPLKLVKHKKLPIEAIEAILTEVKYQYFRAIVAPGEMVGMLAGQSIGENATQLTLNSVTYETEIIVRNKEGLVKKVQIGDFVNKHINDAKKIENHPNDTTYAEPKEYFEVPSCDEDGNVSWREIEAVTRHPVINKDGSNTMLKFTTKEQREIIVTKAKSLLKLIDGKIVNCDGDNFKVGDYLVVSTKQTEFTESYTMDLRNVFLPNEYLYMSEVEKAKAVMNENFWWKKHNIKTFVLPYNRSDSFRKAVELGTMNPLSNNCIYTKNYTGCENQRIPEVITLNYNFGYLIGAYCAEGCHTIHQISISNNDANYFEPILQLCDEWGITTKLNENKNKNGVEGHQSQDLRIFSTLLTRLIINLCGSLSHNKYVSDIITFSNRECMLGFIDAYIGGDGYICNREKSIIIGSVSKTMLTDVQQILNNLGIYSSIKIEPIRKPFMMRDKLVTNIKQGYTLRIRNRQAKHLASLLNMKIDYKQENVQIILNNPNGRNYEINKNYLKIPNEINGELVLQDRTEDIYKDVLFDEVISIEEVENTTPYAYDLTVEFTRNFNIYNNIALRDTFHLSGTTKSNVTRGVPRMEEVLSLTKEPKNTSLTVYPHKSIQDNKTAIKLISQKINHTILRDVVSECNIIYNDTKGLPIVNKDGKLVNDHMKFEKLFEECSGINSKSSNNTLTKWIIRIIFNRDELFTRGLTMDDVHFAISRNYDNDELSCIFSDYNSPDLVARISVHTIKEKAENNKYKNNSLDQTDYLSSLRQFQFQLLDNLVLRGVSGISAVSLREIKDNVYINEIGETIKQELYVIDTTGTNLKQVMKIEGVDSTKTISNSIIEIHDVLGIEAARQSIYNEIEEVVAFDGTYINPHHYSILCDRMTYTNQLISIIRHGLNNDENTSVICKASFEETSEIFLRAAKHGEIDNVRGVSAATMLGQLGSFGTNMFNVLLDDKMFNSLLASVPKEDIQTVKQHKHQNVNLNCSVSNLTIDNSVYSILPKNSGIMEDDYIPDGMF